MVNYSKSILGPKAVNKLKNVFQEIDNDKSGTVSLFEFEEACKRLSIEVNTEELQDFLGSDGSGDGELNFEEFCNFYISRLHTTFGEIDLNNSGEIGVEELRNAFLALGFNSTVREVAAVLKEVDKDSNESVDFEEFCNFFCSLPSPNLRLIMEQWASGLSIDTGSDLAPPPIPPPSMVLWRALFAGGIAGVVSRTLTAPLEKIKILAQTSTTGKLPVMQSIASVWKQEKLRGLLAGNGANCLRVFPFSALVCLAYANLARNFPLDDGSSPYNAIWRMGSGAFAGMFATVLTHPIDVVRARLTVQSQNNKVFNGISHGLKEIAAKEKFPGLYRGIGPTLLAIAPFMAVQQATYDVLKHQAMKRNVEPTALLFFVCGSIAGAAAQSSVYPLDVIRRRMQVQCGPQHIKFMSLTRSLSFKQLYSGLFAAYLKVMPAAAISLLVRDAILGRLKK